MSKKIYSTKDLKGKGDPLDARYSCSADDLEVKLVMKKGTRKWIPLSQVHPKTQGSTAFKKYLQGTGTNSWRDLLSILKIEYYKCNDNDTCKNNDNDIDSDCDSDIDSKQKVPKIFQYKIELKYMFPEYNGGNSAVTLQRPRGRPTIDFEAVVSGIWNLGSLPVPFEVIFLSHVLLHVQI